MSSGRYRYYRLNPKEKEVVKGTVKEILKGGGMELTIIFGNFVEMESFRDVDVAVYADSRELDLNAVIKLSVELEERLHIPVGVVPLNEGSPSFRHYILTGGEVVLEKRPGLCEALLMRTLNANARRASSLGERGDLI
ncbi:MAG: nucleotidyltransferase domain-containing protein [Candidatus Nezhaarchaeales archaeon]